MAESVGYSIFLFLLAIFIIVVCSANIYYYNQIRNTSQINYPEGVTPNNGVSPDASYLVLTFGITGLNFKKGDSVTVTLNNSFKSKSYFKGIIDVYDPATKTMTLTNLNSFSGNGWSSTTSQPIILSHVNAAEGISNNQAIGGLIINGLLLAMALIILVWRITKFFNKDINPEFDYFTGEYTGAAGEYVSDKFAAVGSGIAAGARATGSGIASGARATGRALSAAGSGIAAYWERKAAEKAAEQVKTELAERLIQSERENQRRQIEIEESQRLAEQSKRRKELVEASYREAKVKCDENIAIARQAANIAENALEELGNAINEDDFVNANNQVNIAKNASSNAKNAINIARQNCYEGDKINLDTQIERLDRYITDINNNMNLYISRMNFGRGM